MILKNLIGSNLNYDYILHKIITPETSPVNTKLSLLSVLIILTVYL